MKMCSQREPVLLVGVGIPKIKVVSMSRTTFWFWEFLKSNKILKIGENVALQPTEQATYLREVVYVYLSAVETAELNITSGDKNCNDNSTVNTKVFQSMCMHVVSNL